MTYLELRDKLEVISKLTNANATDIDNIIKVYTTVWVDKKGKEHLYFKTMN